MSPLAIILLAALLPAPQAPPDETGARAGAEFAHLRDDAMELLRGNVPAASAERLERALGDERAEAQTRELGFQRVSALDPTASSVVDRATLGLGTSVEGAEAGLSVSPAALAGSTNPKAIAFNVFVGALKSDETRVGVRYTFERSGELGPSTSRTSARSRSRGRAPGSTRSRTSTATCVAWSRRRRLRRAGCPRPPGRWRRRPAASPAPRTRSPATATCAWP